MLKRKATWGAIMFVVLTLAVLMIIYLLLFLTGAVTPTKIPITVISYSQEKVYDGTPLVNETWMCEGEDALKSGHSLKVTVHGTRTSAGQSQNHLTVTVIDEAGLDVSDEYEIDARPGVLTVTPIKVTVSTNSAQKEYDGTPLTDAAATVENGNVLPGHEVIATVTGFQTVVGESENTVSCHVVDQRGNDVTQNYEFVYNLGKLQVSAAPGSEGSGEGSGAGSGAFVNGSGGLMSEMDLNGTDGADIANGMRDSIAMTVLSDTDGRKLLRYTSFGNYTMSGWDSNVHHYSAFDISSLYLTSIALQNVGAQAHNMTINVNTSQHYVPYFTTTDTIYGDSDVLFPYSDSEYSLKYYGVSDVSAVWAASLVGTGYEMQEESYRAYVNSMYLSIPETTRQSMLEIAAANGISASDITVITQVVNYVNGAATYNLNFAQYPEDVDMAVYFLTEAKEGVCRHFATAATLMFRALGIPARCVGGYAVDTVAGEWVEVSAKQAHAWVEVYVNGIGWIAVDPTAGIPNADGDGVGGDGDEGGGDIEGGSGDVEDGNGDLEDGSGEGFVKLGDDMLLNDDGGLGDSEGGGNLLPAVRLLADITGRVYLRYTSHGSYNYNGWSSGVTVYAADKGNPLYLTSIALANSGYTSNKLDIETLSGQFYLPYYGVATTVFGYNDVKLSPGMDNYNINYFYVPMEQMLEIYDTLTLEGSGYESLELDYRDHVYSHYLDIPMDTMTSMLEIAYAYGLSAEDEDIIVKVADYIRNAAAYNLDFAKYPEDVDMAVYFLTEAREGVCRHFATAATLMYRALGIPARCVSGFAGNAVDGEWVSFGATEAHAWVEVYIDGLGWLPVEVTGSASEVDPVIVVKPKDTDIEYTGEAFDLSTLEAQLLMGKLLDPTHTVVAEFDCEYDIIDFGIYTVSVTGMSIYDEYGNDVTYMYTDAGYEIHYSTGTVTVTKKTVTVSTGSLSKEYDGTVLSGADAGYSITNFSDGHYATVKFEISITDIGVAKNVATVNIFDENGNDITDNYHIDASFGQLEITRRRIVITAGSVQEECDFENLVPIVCHEWSVTDGSLVYGHTAVCTFDYESTMTYPGRCENIIKDTVIVDENGNDVTDYYIIEYVKGTIDVTFPSSM